MANQNLPTTKETLTADNIKLHLDKTAKNHNGFGSEVFITLVSVGLDDTNLARAMNLRDYRTARKWRVLLGFK